MTRSRSIDLGTGDVQIRDIREVCLSFAPDGGAYIILDLRNGLDLMIYSDPDPDQVMRVICALEGALEHGPRRVVLTDLVRAAQRGMVAE